MSILSKKKNIKEILITYNLLTESDYNKYYEESKKENKNLILYLCEKKLINDIKYLKILSDEWGYKPVDLSKLEPPAEVLTIIPEIVSRRHICIAFGKKDNTVYLAMSDPRDFMFVEDIALRTGYSVQPYLSLPHWIMRLIELAYGVQSAAKVTQIVEEITQKAEESEISKIETVQKKDITDIDPSAPEVEKIVNGIFWGAISQKASDIHIEPFEDPSGKNSKVIVRYRVDGVLKLAPFNIPWSFRNAIIAKVK
ncbi:MAG: hypothetical protein N2Z60_04660, partial [Elusimicrobiales bacterium]|nr:hypothetical protein [Elusimicrobiales bacterium]